MIQGLGTDIIEISRIARLIKNSKFLSKIYTQNEISYIKSKKNNAAESAAGFFSAKEAVAKALGTGFNANLHFNDIEIYHDNNGKPNVRLLNEQAHKNILISISHCKEYAVATAILL